MLRDILIFGVLTAIGPQPVQAPVVEVSEQSFKLSVTAELVLLDVSVRNSAGEYISYLSKDSFSIYEDGKLQTITHFENDDAPVTVGLVIDKSGSMRPKYGTVVTAALSFIRASNQKDEVFIVNFGDSVTLGLPGEVPFSSDYGQLRTALSWEVPAGRTALYDAIVFALQHLEMGKRERKTLLLVSDGGDNSSRHGAEEVMRMVRESRATIYTIGIFDPDDRDRNPGLLRRLSQVSGGEAFLPAQLSDVVGICQRIARDIRSRYTIGYVPVRSGEAGALRKLSVTAIAPGGHKLVIHTRSSYVLPPLNAKRGL